MHCCEDETSFPSQTTEGHGPFIGFSDDVGNALTHATLTDDTNEIMHHSEVRSAEDGKHTNLCANDWGDIDEASPDLPHQGIICSNADDDALHGE